MEETLQEAIETSLPVGLLHIHKGEAVLKLGNRFYGHMHPPLAVHEGMFHYDIVVEQFMTLFQYGLIPKEEDGKRAGISLEVRPYLGCTGQTSVQLMYEVIKSACDEADRKLEIY